MLWVGVALVTKFIVKAIWHNGRQVLNGSFCNVKVCMNWGARVLGSQTIFELGANLILQFGLFTGWSALVTMVGMAFKAMPTTFKRLN